MRRMIYLWLPFLATDRLAIEKKPEVHRLASCLGEKPQQHRPLGTVATIEGQKCLAALDLAAQQAGLHVGMSLLDARALCPTLRHVESDSQGEERTLTALSNWCERYAPWIAIDNSLADGAGGLWLDVTGCASLFGDEESLMADLLAHMRRFGYHAQAAMASTAMAATLLARFAPQSLSQTGYWVPAGQDQDALKPLSLAHLTLSAEVKSTLRCQNIRTFGDLFKLSRQALDQRFGPELAQHVSQILGKEPETLKPRRPIPAFHTRVSLPKETVSAQDVKAGLRQMLAVLCKRLKRQDRGARRLELVLYYRDGRVRRNSVGSCAANRDPQTLEKLFTGHFKHWEDHPASYQEAIDSLLLTVPVTESLSADTPLEAPDISTKTAKYRRPTASARQPQKQGLIRAFGPEDFGSTAMEALPEIAPPIPGRVPPVRLLPQPEPIDTVSVAADRLPESFRWRQKFYQVKRADGPDHIVSECSTASDHPPAPRAKAVSAAYMSPARDQSALCREDAFLCAEKEMRDYYQIEDMAGERYWLYRDGPVDAEGSRWYVHGLFANA